MLTKGHDSRQNHPIGIYFHSVLDHEPMQGFHIEITPASLVGLHYCKIQSSVPCLEKEQRTQQKSLFYLR